MASVEASRLSGCKFIPSRGLTLGHSQSQNTQFRALWFDFDMHFKSWLAKGTLTDVESSPRRSGPVLVVRLLRRSRYTPWYITEMSGEKDYHWGSSYN